MASEPFPISFGNGFVAYVNPATDEPFLELGHYGLDVPEFDVAVTERGVGDGGTVGNSRANARHMRATIWHNGKWSRRAIMQAFTPGVERTISTALGSMPYYVEALEFPESLHEADKRFSVNLVSPLAYPLGNPLAKASDPMTFATTEYHAAGTEFVNANATRYGSIGTTFIMQPGQTLVSCGLYICPQAFYPADIVFMGLYEVSPGIDPQPGALIAGEYVIISRYNYDEVWKDYVIPVNHTFPTGEPTKVMLAIDRTPKTSFKMVEQPEDTYTATSILISAEEGWGSQPGSLAMVATVGTPASTTNEVYVTAGTDLPCLPKVTVTLDASASTLVLTSQPLDATAYHYTATKITGALASGDVVVFDSAERTITVNGIDRIAWFDRKAEWPVLFPGLTRLTTNAQGTVAIEWQPRMMGLI